MLHFLPYVSELRDTHLIISVVGNVEDQEVGFDVCVRVWMWE